MLPSNDRPDVEKGGSVLQIRQMAAIPGSSKMTDTNQPIKKFEIELKLKALKAENARLRDALVRVMNSDLVTTSQFRDYSETFDNARKVLEETK
jgi:hypothetical protein